MADTLVDARWGSTVQRLCTAGGAGRALLFCCAGWMVIGFSTPSPWIYGRGGWDADGTMISGWMRMEGQFALLCAAVALLAAAWRYAAGANLRGWSSLTVLALALMPPLLVTVRLQLDVAHWRAADGAHPVEGWHVFEPRWGLTWTLLAALGVLVLLGSEAVQQARGLARTVHQEPQGL